MNEWEAVYRFVAGLGTEQTVVSSEAIPIECHTGEKRRVVGLGLMVPSFDLAKVDLNLNDWKAEL